MSAQPPRAASRLRQSGVGAGAVRRPPAPPKARQCSPQPAHGRRTLVRSKPSVSRSLQRCTRGACHACRAIVQRGRGWPPPRRRPHRRAVKGRAVSRPPQIATHSSKAMSHECPRVAHSARGSRPRGPAPASRPRRGSRRMANRRAGRSRDARAGDARCRTAAARRAAHAARPGRSHPS